MPDTRRTVIKHLNETHQVYIRGKRRHGDARNTLGKRITKN